jgi:membrane protease YdiL (CAAX protease family)
MSQCAPVNQEPLSRDRRLAWLSLLLLVPAPSLGVFIAMLWEPTRGTPAAQTFYAAMKVWILLVPMVWTLLIDRRHDAGTDAWTAFRWPTDGRKAMGMGIGLGALIGLVIVVTYFIVANSLIDANAMREAASRNGIGTPGRCIAFTIVLATVNAWLEEYVWRWFVFRKCEVLMGGRIAVVVSALFFTLHHILALIGQTSWQVTALACVGVFIGGCVWSWCFLRFRSIWPGYVSHVIVDVAVFAVGYLILFT